MLSRSFVIALWSLLAAFSPLWAQPGYDDFSVERFTREQGYNPDVEPLCFLQDKKGVMWIGTSDGLYRYDGTFRRYVHEVGNPFSLPKNSILTLYEDKENVLWASITNGGLVRFDRNSERFIQYSNRAGDTSSLPATYYIFSIIEDRDGRFWLATADSGIIRFDRHTGKVARRYPFHVEAQSFALDGSGRLWVSSQNDRFIYRYDERSDSFMRSPFELPFTANMLMGVGDTLWAATNEKRGVYAVNVREGRVVGEYLKNENHFPQCLYYATSDRIWVSGTDIGGSSALFTINPRTGVVLAHRNHSRQNGLVPSRLGYYVQSVYEDRSGVVWLNDAGAADKRNLGKHAPYKLRFKTYRHNPSDSNSLSGNYARALLADDKNNLWVYVQTEGIDRGVLNAIDRTRGTVRRYYPNPRKAGGLTQGIGTLYQDTKGMLWVGANTLQIFDPDRPALGFRTFRSRPSPKKNFDSTFITYIGGDHAGNLWVGTIGAGLWYIPSATGKTGKYLPLRNPQTGMPFPFKYINAVLEDCYGALWIASWDGIIRYDTVNKTFRRYASEAGNPLTIGDNLVTSILETRSGDLWVTTKGGGIARYDRERDVFRKMTMDNGLPHDNCYAILEDGAGLLWISTDNGLCSYNPKTGVVRRYDTDDGLQGNEFNRFSYYQSTSGEMFFGGTGGVSSFFPDLLRDNPTPPLAAIINVRDIGGDTTYLVAYRGEIELTYRQNNLSVEAAALEFTHPERNLYSWHLEGIDTGWTEAKRNRWITYTNLSPGEYRLRVKVANADGVWNTETATLLLRIHPAWWQTWWFRTFVVLASVGALAAVLQVYRRRIARLQEQRAELMLHIEERRRSERKFRALFDTSPLGMILWERSGQIIETNPAFEAITGYGARDGAPLDFRNLVPDSLFALIDYGLERRGAFGPIEHLFTRADGAKLSIILSGIIISEADVPTGLDSNLDNNSDNNRIWSVMEDVTERKRATDAMLRHQLNPHFMFNVLNSISSLLSENPRNAKRMILEFSLLLRHTLDAGSQLTIPLGEEIEAVEHYLDIEKLRFEERLHATVYADPKTLNFNVPVFLIQPLVENAIKYGMESSEEDALRVEVSVTLDGNMSEEQWLRLVVGNSGTWIELDESDDEERGLAALVKQNSTGIGLDNLRKRLQQLYPDGHSMDITETGNMVYVIIRIATRELEQK
ncbi:MAG: histidine kinase [Ignavibacteria bacterium]|nr:histidine kinase [Ignavibacteria bacterium]